MTDQNDVVIRDEGTVVLFIPTSMRGSEWCHQHLDGCERERDGFIVPHNEVEEQCMALIGDEMNIDFFQAYA